MAEEINGYAGGSRGLITLWAGVLAGPAAWAATQQVLYLLVTLECSFGREARLWPVIGAAILIAAGGTWLSWRNWRPAERETTAETDSVARWMGIAGMSLGVFSLLLIVAELVPVFFYRYCQR